MEKLVEALKSFGLSEYEAKVLLALIAKGELTVKEVAEFSGVPRTSVYDVIKSLMEKGLVEAYGKPMKVKALNSEDLMRIFSKKVEENLRYLRRELPAVERERTEEVKVYRGDVAMEKVCDLIRNAKKVVVVAPRIPDEIVKALNESDAEKVVCGVNVDEIDANVKYKGRFKFRSEHGLVIANDRVVAIFFKRGSSIAIVGEGEGFVEFYKSLVESILPDVIDS